MEIYVSPAGTVVPKRLEQADAVAGEGLRGDRYFRSGSGSGTFYEPDKVDQDLTLIELEALEGLREDTGIELGAAEARRNVVTRGVRLNDLVGRRFKVGEVECEGKRLCEPCDHLERLTEPGVLRGLEQRGGLRADIVRGGRIAVGDPVSDTGTAGGPAL